MSDIKELTTEEMLTLIALVRFAEEAKDEYLYKQILVLIEPCAEQLFEFTVKGMVSALVSEKDDLLKMEDEIRKSMLSAVNKVIS